MGSLATFKSAYLDPANSPIPTGQRMQLAGLIYTIERQASEGVSIPTAANAVPTKRSLPVVHKAQAASKPFNFAIVTDYIGISAP
jgi:hypothetical protein